MIKRVLSKILHIFLVLMPFSAIVKMNRRKLLLPMYHIVSDKQVPHVINLFKYCNINQFEKDLDFLQKYFTPISLSDLMKSMEGQKKLPDNPFLLTFDDGLRETLDVIAPILIRRSIPAVFFLNTGFIDNKDISFKNKASLIVNSLKHLSESDIIKVGELLSLDQPGLENLKRKILRVEFEDRFVLDQVADLIKLDFKQYLDEHKPYLDSEEVKKLIEQGFDIGAHSENHPLFRDISLEEQIYQTKVSIEKLKEKFSMKYNAFAFPFTDDGISEEYYMKTHCGGIVDISFGTSNFDKGNCPNNIQRQPMEGRANHAEQIYKSLLRQEILKSILK